MLKLSSTRAKKFSTNGISSNNLTGPGIACRRLDIGSSALPQVEILYHPGEGGWGGGRLADTNKID